jgi:ankyrin repeat protein
MNQFSAARLNNLEHLREVLTRDNVNDVDSDGWTVLHWAAQRGHIGCAKFFLDIDANVRACANDGWTPLHGAVSVNGHVDIACVLLDAGAVVDAVDDNGDTPLCVAICNHKHLLISRSKCDKC